MSDHEVWVCGAKCFDWIDPSGRKTVRYADRTPSSTARISTRARRKTSTTSPPQLSRSRGERSNMSTSQPIWRRKLPAKRPPSDPPMIRVRRFLSRSRWSPGWFPSELGQAAGRCSRWPAAPQDRLARRTGRLGADDDRAAYVEMRNALDILLPSRALQNAHALCPLVRVEEGRNGVPIEADLAGDFGEYVVGSDVASCNEIPVQALTMPFTII